MGKPRHLVFLVSEDWHFVSHRLPLAVAALQDGFRVSVISRQSPASELLKQSGIQVIPFEMCRHGVNPFLLLIEAWRLARIYVAIKPDLVHHIALRPVVVGAIAARLSRVHHIVSSITGLGLLFTQEGRYNLPRFLVKKLLARLLSSNTTVVQNTDDYQFFLSLGFQPDRLHLVPGVGVNLTTFSPGKPDSPPVVMLPCRLLCEKGVYEFLAAARQLRGKVNARFVVVGAPDYGNPGVVSETDLQPFIDDGTVEWWGHSQNMPETLRRATIVCLPSYREGFPKVLAEAMACGKPCIASDVPGCRDAVVDNETGLLVPAKNAAALSEAVLALLSDIARCKELGARGRLRAELHFAQSDVSRRTVGLYMSLNRLQPRNLGRKALPS